MNKVLKMDFRRQTAVLSAVFVLVGMMFLVPAITGKALANINASASGQCGPEGQTHPCQFTLVDKRLDKGSWSSEPTQSGTRVTWSILGTPAEESGEKGSVTYKVGEETAVLAFERYDPVFGDNKCSISWYTPAHTLYYHSTSQCTINTTGKNHYAEFTYSLMSTPPFLTCNKLKATMAEDELANSAQWKRMQCEILLKQT